LPGRLMKERAPERPFFVCAKGGYKL
jgi:hypothetical protein